MIEIEHKIYGAGVAERSRCGGFEFLVRFSSGIQRWVRYDEIIVMNEPQIQPKHKLHEEKIPHDQFLARKAIEALRLGIVPHDSIENFTIGRDRELDQFRKWLENPKKGNIFIRGEYGSGKSHLLEYINSWVLKNEWAVAKVEIGMEENPFHKPHQIYQSLIRNFKCPYQGRLLGFRDFITEVIALSEEGVFEGHQYFIELYRQFQEVNIWRNESSEASPKTGRGRKKVPDESKIWEWIEGEQNWIKPSMSKTGTSSNLYCYLLNAISWSVRNILGCRGLLILFDEAEHLDEITYMYHQIQANNFVKGLMALAENQKVLLKERISLHKKRGYQTGLIYCGYPRNNPIRYAWQYPSELKVLFAMTPIQEYKEKIDLRSLKRDDLLTIAFNVGQFYKNAYHYEIEDEVISKLFKKFQKQKTRIFIKSIVEALDVLRFNPDKSIKEILS